MEIVAKLSLVHEDLHMMRKYNITILSLVSNFHKYNRCLSYVRAYIIL